MPDDRLFADERFMSAAQKNKVLRAWNRFLQSGCAKAQFTHDLYHHLTQHCSFIAHFDRHGFYQVYFEEIGESIFRLFDQFEPGRPSLSAEYGGTGWLSKRQTGSDLNYAMREVAGPYLDKLRQTFLEARRQKEIALASLVLATYGLAVIPAAATATPVDATSDVASHRTAESVQQSLFAEP